MLAIEMGGKVYMNLRLADVMSLKSHLQVIDPETIYDILLGIDLIEENTELESALGIQKPELCQQEDSHCSSNSLGLNKTIFQL